VGLEEACVVGASVGSDVKGTADGWEVGCSVGNGEGCVVGTSEGSDGATDGWKVGCSVGNEEGCVVGTSEGSDDGNADGPNDGILEGSAQTETGTGMKKVASMVPLKAPATGLVMAPMTVYWRDQQTETGTGMKMKETRMEMMTGIPKEMRRGIPKERNWQSWKVQHLAALKFGQLLYIQHLPYRVCQRLGLLRPRRVRDRGCLHKFLAQQTQPERELGSAKYGVRTHQAHRKKAK
jgi:hypothetical protein